MSKHFIKILSVFLVVSFLFCVNVYASVQDTKFEGAIKSVEQILNAIEVSKLKNTVTDDELVNLLNGLLTIQNIVIEKVGDDVVKNVDILISKVVKTLEDVQNSSLKESVYIVIG